MQDGQQTATRQHPLQGISFNRTVIIGLGSTGLKVLESFQELWYERFSNTSNSLVRLINIETDANNRPESIDGNSMIEQITINNNNLDFNQLADLVRTKIPNPLKSEVPDLDWDWNWTNEVNWVGNIGVAGAAGAGGIRAGGRLILYGIKDTQSQSRMIFDNLRKIITDPQKWQNIDSAGNTVKQDIIKDLCYDAADWIEPDDIVMDPVTGPYSKVNPYFDTGIKVIVVGALTGGTCSGTFIDMGFIIKKALDLNENELYKYLTGIFFIPPTDTQHLGGGIEHYRTNANTFGALYELKRSMEDYHNKAKSAPYGSVYVIAPEYNTSDPSNYFDGIDGFSETVALRLFALCLGFGLKVDASACNIFTENPRNYLFSFGIGAVLYPKFTLIKAIAAKLAEEFSSRLIDQTNYINDNKVLKIDAELNKIKENTNKFVNKKLNEIYSEVTKNHLKIKEKNLEWITKSIQKTLDENSFENEYTQKSGFYYSQWLKISPNIEDDIFEDFRKLLIDRIKDWSNVKFADEITIAYIDSLTKIRELLKIQGCKNFPNSLPNMIKEIFSNKNIIDRKESMESNLWLLYEKFVLHKTLEIVDSLIKRAKDLKENLAKVIDRINSYQQKYSKEYDYFLSKLDTHIEKSPTIKLFKEDKQEDFRQVKQLVLGKSIKLGVELFPEQFKETLCQNILNNTIDKSFSEIIILLRKKAEIYLKNYLRDEEEPNEKARKPFNLINKTLEGKNVSIIDKTFNIIRSGFIKRTVDNTQVVPGAVIVHHLISGNSNEELKSVINKYSLKDVDGQCQPYSNPLFEDMIIYVRDIPRIELSALKKYDDLKQAFLEKPVVGFNHLTNKEWQRLRLTLSGEIDFGIIEEEKKKTIDNIKKFISFFWLKPLSEVNFGKIQNPFYKIPEYFEGSKYQSEGLYFFDENWHLKFQVRGSGQEVNLCITSENKSEINMICASNQIYDTLIDIFSKYTDLYSSNAGVYINKLHKYWYENVRPIYQADLKYHSEYYGSTFLDDYDGTENFPINKFTQNKHKSLLGYLMSIKKL